MADWPPIGKTLDWSAHLTHNFNHTQGSLPRLTCASEHTFLTRSHQIAAKAPSFTFSLSHSSRNSPPRFPICHVAHITGLVVESLTALSRYCKDTGGCVWLSCDSASLHPHDLTGGCWKGAMQPLLPRGDCEYDCKNIGPPKNTIWILVLRKSVCE